MLPALFLILFATLYRLATAFFNPGFDWVSNFSPLASIVFCGAVFFPKKWALAIPLLVMAFTDVVLNVFKYHEPLFTMEILPRYVAFAAVGAMALWIRKQQNHRTALIFGGTVVGSLAFYLITNTASWMTWPAYTKDFHGWIQAVTVGDPAFTMPTWMFFRNSVVSDLLFTGLFVACIGLSRRFEAPASAAHGNRSLATR
ncbi:MAG TPA: DUF6580 family putative transport protein [Chthoniobacterales bacterium]